MRIVKLRGLTATALHSQHQQGGSKTNHLYVIDDTDEGEEKKDSIGVMSGVSFSENGKSMVRPQALASDDQVRDKLFETIKRNKEYVATMKKLRKMYRSQLQKYNKLSEQLTNVQDELHAATHSAATGGASMFTAKINVNNVSAKEDEERARREKERKKLLQAGGDDGDYNDIFGVQEGTMNFFQIVRYTIKRIMTQYEPLKRDVDQVEARFGSAVASYYRFNQWITKSSINVMLLYLVLIVYQIILKTQNPASDTSFDWNDWFAYSAFVQGNMPLYYSFLLILVNAILIYASMNKWIVEDRKAKVINALQGNAKKFANISLNCFDHSLHEEDDVNDVMMGNAEQFMAMLISEKIAERLKNRTFKEKVKLYTKRWLLRLVYVALQGVGVYGIVQLILFESVFTRPVYEAMGLSKEEQANIPIDVVPLVVSIINTVIPKIIIKLVALEAYDDKMDEVEQVVSRIFVSKTINNVIQLVSYSLLANPFFFQTKTLLFPEVSYRSIRQRFSKKFDPDVFMCRGDMAGNSIFNILITEFIMHKIFLILFPGIRWISAKKGKKAMKKTAFNIELKMIGLLYYTQICLICLPLYPLAGILMFITLYINFKSEKVIMFWSNVKPKTGSGGGNLSFFLKFFLISSMISVIYCTFLLSWSTFPKDCSVQAQSIPQNVNFQSNGLEIRAEDDSYALLKVEGDEDETDECYTLLEKLLEK